MPDSREVLTRPAPPPDRTLRYGPHPYHVIDVRLPVSPVAGTPLVVVLHGGFWRAMYDRSHLGPMTSALAVTGYVVATRSTAVRRRAGAREAAEAGRKAAEA